MSKFAFQKFLWDFSFPIAILLFVGVLAYAFFTEVSQPEQGTVAPFSATLQAQTPTTSGFQALPLEQPNRTSRELQEWVSMAVSEVLTLDAVQYETQLSQGKGYFTDDGYTQFVSYLNDSTLFDILKNGDLKTSVFVETPPLLLNDGPVGGVYRWLYDVPVTISYIPRTITNYTKTTDAQVRRVNVRVQVGRIDDPAAPEAVRIESWVVTLRRK